MIAQIGIMFFGATAVWLSQDARAERRKWASVFGLLGQPFWYWAAYSAEQWGILAICIVYTYSWARGFYNFWLKNEG